MAEQLGYGVESVRSWVPQADIDDGVKAGVTTDEQTRMRPNQLWVTDLTFVPTWQGVAYVCFIIDAFSRMIVGRRCASSMKTETVLDAIEMARWSRGARHEDLRCHSCQGPLSSAHRRPVFLPAGGHQNCPLVASWFARLGGGAGHRDGISSVA